MERNQEMRFKVIIEWPETHGKIVNEFDNIVAARKFKAELPMYYRAVIAEIVV